MMLDPSSNSSTDTRDFDITSNQDIFTSLSPSPIILQTPSIELNQNDQTENLEQFSPTTSEINEPTSGSGTRTPLPPNIIDGDPTTTGLEYCENIPPPPSLNIPNVENLEGDLDILNTLRSKYTNNPSIGYLNINSLRGQKFSQLENICKSAKIDILCIDETKLSSEIPTSRIHIDGYQYPPLRRDREQKKANSFGGGKLVYIKEGFICKRISEFETKTSETICIELSLRNKKWFIMFGYRPESIKREIFFEEVNLTLSKAINKYENILFIGDLNIDLNIPNHDKKHFLQDLCDIFDLTNMVKDKTCFMSTEGSSIDVMLTNKPELFYKTTTIETGLSDHHKLVLTFLRNHHSYKLKPKKDRLQRYEKYQ